MPPTIEELQKQLDSAEKKTEQAEARIASLEAKLAPAPADAAAAAKTAKDLAEAEKAAAEAKKAQAEAELAALKVSFGEVPSSGISGTVEARDGTGELEAALLAVKAVQEATNTIATSVMTSVTRGSTIVIVGEADVPTFASLRAYETEVALVKEILNKAIAAATPTKEEAVAKEAVPLPGAAGLALDAASKLLSFFRTDFVVKGLTVSLEDSVAVNAVAGTLAAPDYKGRAYTIRVPAVYDPGTLSSSTSFLIADLFELSTLRGQAQSLLKTHDQTSLANAIQSAIGLMDTWYSKLSTPDAKGIATLAHVVKEKAIADSLDHGYLLVMKVHKAGGAFMTKKNLWTSLGVMPLYHMGGAAVSFTLFKGRTGRVLISGVVPVHGGFVKAGKIRRELGR